MSGQPLAIYVHIPFCPTKCGYCDFNSYAMEGDIIKRTVAAIERDIRSSPAAGRPAKTIFFGGGTPTFLEADDLCRLLESVLDVHPPEDRCEITSEANPGTVDASKFASMRKAGFNRISLGAQSFLDSDLVRLGRIHRSGEIEKAVEAARSAGFENINADLMYALPGQSEHAWSNNLERAIALNVEHLSLYCLTIEKGTAFYTWREQGKLDLPGEEDQIAMSDKCIDLVEAAGFHLYEISNYAKPGRECLHNLCYWRAEEYAGYGPGAVGRWGLERTTRLKNPYKYCEAIESGSNLNLESETLDDATLEIERTMLGMRLSEGITPRQDWEPTVEKLLQREWIERHNERIRLTHLGRRFCNEVVVELI